MRLLGRIEPGSGSGPGTGHTGLGLAGRATAAGFFAAAVVPLSAVAESVAVLSDRGTRVVSCAALADTATSIANDAAAVIRVL
jgi:hypothetical protein